MKYKFDALIEMVPALLRQGVPSIDPDIGCRYRGQNGTKCAVGQIIHDDVYTPSIENELVGHPLVHDCLVKSGFDVDESMENMLIECQEIHDQTAPGMWRDEFIGLASRHLNDVEFDKFNKAILGVKKSRL